MPPNTDHPTTPSPRSSRTLGPRTSWAFAAVLLAVGLTLASVAVARWRLPGAGTAVTLVVDRTFKTTNYHDRAIQEVAFHYDWDGQRVDDDQEVPGDEAARWPVGSRLPGRAGVLFGQHLCASDIGRDEWRGRTWAIAVSGVLALAMSGLYAWSARRQRTRTAPSAAQP
jgi:hypothetical protein